ncbi:MAG: class I adenylate-forming enzyme family protein [Myxococcaceae bacterium]
MNFAQALLSVGAPEATALLTASDTHTYAALRQGVASQVARLVALHVRPGDAVLIVSENSFFAVTAYLGALWHGAIAIPLATNLSVEQIRQVAVSTRAKVAFVQEKGSPDFDEALSSTVLRVREGASSSAQVTDSAGSAAAEVERDALAVLLFTSGSTSQPRGVMLTHGNLMANTDAILQALGLQSADRAMMVLPFYYSFGASLLHTHLKVGGSVVFDRRMMFPDKVLRRMQETACTGFAGVPSHFQILLRRSQFARMQFPDLRWIQQAGGKLAPHFIEELARAHPKVRMFVMYGATEATARLTCLAPELTLSKLGSVGRPIPGVHIDVLDENGLSVPRGVVGEIVASGPNIALGYWEAPEESTATFRGGRLHTGDLAREDDEGFLYIVDRAKDFIKCAGNRTSTKMLEETLLKFPDIVEAAVLGMPDETLGEAVAVWVVPRSASHDAQLAERLVAFAREQLAPPLVPKQVRVVSALPKNSAGKVMKRALRAETPA